MCLMYIFRARGWRRCVYGPRTRDTARAQALKGVNGVRPWSMNGGMRMTSERALASGLDCTLAAVYYFRVAAFLRNLLTRRSARRLRRRCSIGS